MSEGAVASQKIEVQIFPAFRGKASVPRLRLVAKRALAIGCGPRDASLSLAIADDETVRRLNRDYRGLDETTDVLAFAFQDQGHDQGDGSTALASGEDPFITALQGEGFLGEVIISYPQCARQALHEGREVDEELALLATHGVLHILGYDHITPDEEYVMRERETSVLTTFGYNRGQ